MLPQGFLSPNVYVLYNHSPLSLGRYCESEGIFTSLFRLHPLTKRWDKHLHNYDI